MVLVENLQFLNFFILDYIAKAIGFYNISERKNDFLGYENNKLEKSEN